MKTHVLDTQGFGKFTTAWHLDAVVMVNYHIALHACMVLQRGQEVVGAFHVESGSHDKLPSWDWQAMYTLYSSRKQIYVGFLSRRRTTEEQQFVVFWNQFFSYCSTPFSLLLLRYQAYIWNILLEEWCVFKIACMLDEFFHKHVHLLWLKLGTKADLLPCLENYVISNCAWWRWNCCHVFSCSLGSVFEKSLKSQAG
jgi:hypothetical protein